MARAVHAARIEGRGAYLDARTAIGEEFPHAFPGVFAACMRAGLDPRVSPIPVMAACHYHMGGIAADADGRTTAPGLYAVGECAATGVHGANRLASNSLLEAAAFGRRAGQAAAAETGGGRPAPVQIAPDLPDAALADLRDAMTTHAGVVRTAEGLATLIALIDDLEARHGPAAALLAARLIAQAALDRRESRGGHYRADHPETAARAEHTRVRLATRRRWRRRNETIARHPDRTGRATGPGRGPGPGGRRHRHGLHPRGGADDGAFASRSSGVLAGVDAVRLAVLALDPQARIDQRLNDGDALTPGAVIAVVEADARAFLSAERTALNLVGRLSGVATLTRTYVQAVSATAARIADTRKTTPGLRALEKHAVACGGGMNHRFGLDDAILIKDNHVAVCGGVAEAVRRARTFAPHLMKVEVEVDGLDQLDAVLALIDEGAAPDVIMLDNFSLADLRTAVGRVAGRIVLEASGGVDLTTVRAIAETGVDVISVGALTHSAPVLDIGLDAL